MKTGKLPFAFVGAIFLFAAAVYMHLPADQPRMLHSEASLGSKEDPGARARYEWMMLRDPATDRIPDNIREREHAFARTLPTREQVDALSKQSSTNSVNWLSRGPWNVGGRTRALAVDKNNPNTLIAGGVSGGIWRSVDGGATWTKRSVPSSLHSVSCLAQDRQTSTWYYGTGERIGNSAGGGGAPYRGNGVFKSVDNGVTWTVLASTAAGDPQAFDQFFDYVWNIAVHPTTGDVYAATYSAIWKSVDGGTSWTAVRGGAQAPYSDVTDVQIASNGTIYATGSPGSATIQGIWRSDNGTTWQNITPTDMTSYNRVVIGIAPSDPTTVYFVAETPGAGVQNHSIWKYNATTNMYENRSANIPAFGAPVGNFDSQNSYDLVIAVKPDNPDVVLIGGTNLYRSTDGFMTSNNTTWIGGYATANDISRYQNHHPDNHSLAFAPNNASILYSGHDGGISKTTNVLATPLVWEELSRGYLTTQFYTIALDHGTPGSSTLLGGMQDNGCWKTTSASGTAFWTERFGGDGAFTAIADGGAWELVSSQNGNTYRLVGAQWGRIDPQGGTGYLFINPFVVDPNNSSRLYFAGGLNVWRNSDVTQIPLFSNDPTTVNWTRLDNSAFTQDQVSALGVSKANPANRLYVGSSGGNLTRIDNAHTGDPAGVNIGAALPAGYISCVAVDPTDGNRVFVVYSNYNVVSLWYSIDAGQTWTDVEGNLAGAAGPSCRYVTIVPGPANTRYFLGTSTGLYSTNSLTGSTTTWALEGANSIGNVVVSFLYSRQSDGTVVVATHANGVYSSDGSVDVEEGSTQPQLFALHQNYPNPFNPSTTIRFAIPERVQEARLSIYSTTGEEVWSTLLGNREAGEHEVQWNGRTRSGAAAASGVYLYRLTADNYSAARRMLLLK